jgi:hypothetical protein
MLVLIAQPRSTPAATRSVNVTRLRVCSPSTTLPSIVARPGPSSRDIPRPSQVIGPILTKSPPNDTVAPVGVTSSTPVGVSAVLGGGQRLLRTRHRAHPRAAATAWRREGVRARRRRSSARDVAIAAPAQEIDVLRRRIRSLGAAGVDDPSLHALAPHPEPAVRPGAAELVLTRVREPAAGQGERPPAQVSAFSGEASTSAAVVVAQ